MNVTVSCPTLEPPACGNITMTTNGVTSGIYIWCDPGYYVDGAFILSCGTDGQWSDNLPQCSKYARLLDSLTMSTQKWEIISVQHVLQCHLHQSVNCSAVMRLCRVTTNSLHEGEISALTLKHMLVTFFCIPLMLDTMLY